MTTGTHPFRFAALASAALILPFAILQLRNGSVSRDGVVGVAALFGLLWLLPTLSIGTSLRLMRPSSGAGRIAGGRLLLGAVIVVAAALLWSSLLADQFPCFLGAPNCD
jgi:hypothetical protein